MKKTLLNLNISPIYGNFGTEETIDFWNICFFI
jgi:hypothetical protein